MAGVLLDTDNRIEKFELRGYTVKTRFGEQRPGTPALAPEILLHGNGQALTMHTVDRRLRCRIVIFY
jgi:hypothetical protein